MNQLEMFLGCLIYTSNFIKDLAKALERSKLDLDS